MAHYRTDRRGFFRQLEDREERRFERTNEIREMGGLEPRERTPQYYTNVEFTNHFGYARQGGRGGFEQGVAYHFAELWRREMNRTVEKIGAHYQLERSKDEVADDLYRRILHDFWRVDEPIELTNEEKVQRKQAVGTKLEESQDFLFLLEKEEF